MRPGFGRGENDVLALRGKKSIKKDKSEFFYRKTKCRSKREKRRSAGSNCKGKAGEGGGAP